MFGVYEKLLYNGAMKNEQNSQQMIDRRKFYSQDDSGKVYIFALALPILLSIVFVLIANVISGATGLKSEQITDNIWFTTVAQIATAGLFIGIFFVYNKVNKIDNRSACFKTKMPWHTYLIIIAVGIVSLFGVQYFIGAVDDLLKLMGYPLEEPSPNLPESLINPKSFGIFALSVFVTCVLPAISEELLFRGVIFQGLRRRFGDVASILLSSLMFALMHQNLQQLVYPFFLGTIMSWLVLRTGSLFSSMLVHFTNNFLTILFTYLSNVTSFSLELPEVWWFYLLAVLLLAVTFVVFYLIDRFYFKHKSSEEVERTENKTSKYIYISLSIAVVLFLFLSIYNFLI